ncbi:MAG: hypothetical protein EG823_00240 [Actinobacteria bacterium]|nr:hypothetical protein [Actinomycetota bacterium]
MDDTGTPTQPVSGDTGTPIQPVGPYPGTPPESKSSMAVAGWVCFGIGLGLMFASLATFFLYGPLFLVAFVLSIVAMTKGKVGAGIALMLCTLIIPGVMWFSLVAVNIAEANEEEQAALAALEFEDLTGGLDGNYMTCEGKVRNHGSTTVEFVKVGVDWIGAGDIVLDTDWTYVVGGEGLAPGAAKSFSIMSPADKKMRKYRAYIMED